MNSKTVIKTTTSRSKTRSKKSVSKTKHLNGIKTSDDPNHVNGSIKMVASGDANSNNHLITDYFPTLSRRRATAKEVALQHDKLIRHHIVSDTDPVGCFCVKDIKNKGKGVLASKLIPKGSFVCEYSGDLIDLKKAKQREEDYSSNGAGCYMYYFNWSNTTWCVDATQPTGRVGRLINHSRKSPNCKTRIFIHNDTPHLIFIALKDIHPDEEILYDYGERDKLAIEAHPWLKTT